MIQQIQKLFGTEAWLTLVLGAAFVAAFLLAIMILSMGERRQRRSLAARILGRGDRKAKETSTSWVPAGLAQAGERVASVGGFSARLDQKLEQAGLPMRAGEFVALIAVAAAGGVVIGGLLLQNIAFMLLIGAAASFIPYVYLVRARSQRQKKMGEQLADVLSILASSLRAGHSFLQSLDQVASEISEPSASEFHRTVSEIRLGRSIDDAMVAMADRIGSEDMRWAVMAVNVQREVGGNLAEVLDIVSTTVRERSYIHRQVRVLSAEGRYSIGILICLPIGLFAYLSFANPEYIGPLFTHPIGRILLIAGGTLMGFGFLVMKRIVKIDV